MLKNKTMHLCNTCTYQYPNCKSKEIEFGIGKGNDNVISCDCYKNRECFTEKGFCPNCGSYTFVYRDCGKIQCCRCGEVY